MRDIEKLKQIAAKKRESIANKQKLLKKETDKLKDLEAEIEVLEGEKILREVNSLELTPDELTAFRKYVLSNKSSLMEVIEHLKAEDHKQKEGAKPLYE